MTSRWQRSKDEALPDMCANKVFVLAPREDWIVDRFVNEWNADNRDITTTDVRSCDAIWLMADWCWTKVPLGHLATKKVLTTVHHVVPDKFGSKERQEFLLRDQYTTAYHVPNDHTGAFVRQMTSKPVHTIPYWANQNIWHKTVSKDVLRKKHGLPAEAFIVGSFQRDTEGSDLVSPKLEKGPDLFADNMQRLSAVEPRLHVVLSGWRRQYLMNRLRELNVSHSYFELPPQEVVNELYQTLDMYVVSSRFEGGPQALLECGMLGVPCISRDVGMARDVLPSRSVNDDLWIARPSVPNVARFTLPGGYAPYRELLRSL